MLRKPYWQIDGNSLDPSAFFRALPSHFPDATTLYVEGCGVAPAVEDCYRRHAEPGPFLPERGTLFPPSKKLRCEFSQTLCEELAQLSGNAAEPELADHLHLYRGEEHLLCWYDAFAHDLWLTLTIPEDRAGAFASVFGRKYGVVEADS